MSRIEMVRSGGFAGLSLRCAVDTAARDEPEAAWFEEALGALDLAGLAGLAQQQDQQEEQVGGTGGGQPDRFRYDLAVDRDGERLRLSYPEAALPAPLRPVVERLVERARRGGRTGDTPG